MTPDARARLVEVVARGIWNERIVNDVQWENAIGRDKDRAINYAEAAIAAAERAGFKWEKSTP